jgi:hypothetical protein
MNSRHACFSLHWPGWQASRLQLQRSAKLWKRAWTDTWLPVGQRGSEVRTQSVGVCDVPVTLWAAITLLDKLRDVLSWLSTLDGDIDLALTDDVVGNPVVSTTQHPLFLHIVTSKVRPISGLSAVISRLW